MNVPLEGRPTKPTGGATALLGTEANAFFIMGKTAKLLKRAGASPEFVKAYNDEATSGDYDHLLAASMLYLDSAPEADFDYSSEGMEYD